MKSVIFLCSCLACLVSATPVAAQYLYCEDDFYAVADGSTVKVYHDGAEYNCCPDPFTYEVVFDDFQIHVTETENLSEPCDCICCFDVGVEIEDVSPGTYEVIFSWFDYGPYEWLVQSMEVTVEDLGQSGQPAVGDIAQSDCYWEPTGVPDPTADPWAEPPPSRVSWGSIKALYH